MKIIAAILDNGVLKPSETIPSSAVCVICDGTNYTVYEDGDELPSQE